MMIDTRRAVDAWLQRGNQAAARWIVETYWSIVFRTVRSWLPDVQMAEDVTQEVFIKAFKALPGMKVDGRMDAWLCCIARNTCANVLRGLKRRFIFTALECGFDDFDEIAAPDEEPCPVDDALRMENLQRLLEMLHEQDHRILWLYHVEGLTAEDVGRQMGLSAGAVRVRAMRSQRALRGKALDLRARGRL